MKIIRWFGIAAAMVWVLGTLAPAQSVAGVAKKDKTPKTAPAGRTFTNEDLQGRSGSVSTSSVPAKVQTAAKPKGRSTPARKSSPPPSSGGASAPATNQMTPMGLGQTVKGELGDKAKR